MSNRYIKKAILVLIVISLVVRAFIAGMIELGNDEVYYWIYAVYPDWSHFDHPPMVGWMIQLFTLNLLFDQAFFLRLTSIIFGTLGTWLVYIIGTRLKNKRTGFYAALIYTASIYCFIICGTFILPDASQSLFWLLSLYLLIDGLTTVEITDKQRRNILFAGCTIGLALLSKYTSAFLWAGALGYIILYKRQWLREKTLYFSLFLSLIIFLPVIFWNINHEFISFAYQGERVKLFQSVINLDYFGTELLGQVFYNNPVNFIIIIFALAAVVRKRQFISKPNLRLLLLLSLPLIFVFLVFSLFRQTLPHWTGPGYFGLILIAAAYMDELPEIKGSKSKIPFAIQISLYFLLIILILGIGQIRQGWIYHDRSTDPKQIGKNDISLDLYGWKQLGRKFIEFKEESLMNRNIPPDLPIVSYRWFPAANLDYYVARPTGTYVLAIGSLEKIHKYAWINKKRGGFRTGMDAFYIAFSRDYKDPYELFSSYFKSIEPLDTIHITRGDEIVMNAFVYYLKDLQVIPNQ
jgi:asparagine N-glycosylation enzyme membrane subunit Stt3